MSRAVYNNNNNNNNNLIVSCLGANYIFLN